MTAAAAISAQDGARLSRLGVAAARIRVLGDPRYDSVIDRVSMVDRSEPLLRFGHGAPTLVAGSTWPQDEAVLLPAFMAIRKARPDARLILVPHEPTQHHLAGIAGSASGVGLPPPVRLSCAQEATPLLIVDQVGLLAALYGAGSMAYVGGGFGRAGLHSVLEPAAWAVPVAFGPRWSDSRDAALLLEAGGATALPVSGFGRAVTALARQWSEWIADDGSRRDQGLRARQVVERGAGASERTGQMLAELISSRPPRTLPNEGRSARRSVR